MKKRIILLLFITISFTSYSQFKKLVKQFKSNTQTIALSQNQIGNGLKEALNKGIKNQVSKLTATDGFYKNELVKIMLPKELQVVDKTLRRIGLSSLADQGIKALNRAAEDAVKTATPIFVKAVKEITFTDAKNILTSNKNAATLYLQQKTSKQLYKKFTPVIKNSFTKVGADKIWAKLINKYNSMPFVKKVNPNLTDYVAQQALKGVFTMIEIEEKGIREKASLRTSPLLKSVFALQDRN